MQLREPRGKLEFYAGGRHINRSATDRHVAESRRVQGRG
jgi:hypothetical protein